MQLNWLGIRFRSDVDWRCLVAKAVWLCGSDSRRLLHIPVLELANNSCSWLRRAVG